MKNGVTHESRRRDATTIRIADVFCGAGGLSYGVREAIWACGLRFESKLAVDFDPIAIEVYRRNFDPERASTENLWTAITKNYGHRSSGPIFLSEPRLLDDTLQDAVGKVDLLLGGPPCEGHSNSNNVSRRNDPRNRYYLVMPAMAVALGATVVIVENVPGVRLDSQGVLDTARGLFQSYGYSVDEWIVDAMSLGLPQTRKRHILVASKIQKPDIQETVKQLMRPHRDLAWAIDDLMHLDSKEPWDLAPELSETNKRRIKYLFDNDEYDLPNSERPESHKRGNTYPSIYGRLRWDRPAGTITTGFNTPGRGRYVHPEMQRTITAHEAARIQGFPDVFEFNLIDGTTLSRKSLSNLIGDAVPPQVGYAAGVAALAAMNLTVG